MKQYSTLDMNGNKIINCPSLSGGGDATLVEDITSNVAVGGAPAGTLFEKDLEFTDFAKKILRTSILPNISVTTNQKSLNPKGSTLAGVEITLTISNLSQITVDPFEVEFQLNGTTLDTQSFVDGTATYKFSYPDPVTSNITFTGILKYDETLKSSKSVSVKFANPSYYGFASSTSLTDSDILSLANQTLKDTKSFTWSNINMSASRFCYAYPKSFGSLSSIKDNNNFEYINSYTCLTVNANSEDYLVYVLTDPVSISNGVQIYS